MAFNKAKKLILFFLRYYFMETLLDFLFDTSPEFWQVAQPYKGVMRLSCMLCSSLKLIGVEHVLLSELKAD